MFNQPDGNHEDYPTSITAEELKAGFKSSTVPNLNMHAFEPENYRALVCDLGQGRIAVKIKNPAGNIEYSIISLEDGSPIGGPLDSVAKVGALRQPVPAPQKKS